MEIKFMPKCQAQAFIQIKDKLKYLFEVLFDGLKLNTVDSIIITEDDADMYIQTIVEYSKDIDENIHVTNNPSMQGVAMVIHGVIDGSLKQRIFVKASIFLTFLHELQLGKLDGVPEEDASQTWAIQIVMHEVGHAVDYQILFNKYKYSPIRKKFSFPDDYDEYAKAEGLTLWSEYYAERLACCFIKCPNQFSERNLVDFLLAADFDPYKRISHAFRALYFLAHYVAYFHQYDQPIPFFENAPYGDLRDAYLKLFKPISNYWRSLHQLVGHWDFNYVAQMLAVGFKGIVDLDTYLYEKANHSP